MRTPPRRPFSPREQQVADLACKGLTAPEMAVELGLAPRTVDHYRMCALDAARARNVQHLVAILYLEKIAELNDQNELLRRKVRELERQSADKDAC